METGFDFKQLVALCCETHEAMRQRAARSINIELVVRNWLFGCYIVEYEQKGKDRAEYGRKVLKQLSALLSQELGRGFSVDSLEQMRRFFSEYKTIFSLTKKSETESRILSAHISETPSRIFDFQQTKSNDWILKLASKFHLGWSHYVTLLSVDNSEERKFYEIEAVKNSWSVRELERQISSSLYERLALSRNKGEINRLSKEGLTIEKPADLIKNPFVLEFLGLEEKTHYSEDQFETAIINQLESFLLELGKGFLFEARQKRFTFDNDHFYVDLVFYNRLLRCYVLIDLKRDKLTHQDLGQMQMYVNYFDRHVKTNDELPTVGIVLCSRKNDALVELTLPEDGNIFASKYQLYLPSKEELKQQVQRATKAFQNEIKGS